MLAQVSPDDPSGLQCPYSTIGAKWVVLLLGASGAQSASRLGCVSLRLQFLCLALHEPGLMTTLMQPSENRPFLQKKQSLHEIVNGMTTPFGLKLGDRVTDVNDNAHRVMIEDVTLYMVGIYPLYKCRSEPRSQSM